MDNQYEPHDNRKGSENEKQADYKDIYRIAKIQKVFIGTMLLYFILGMTHYAVGVSAKMAIQMLFYMEFFGSHNLCVSN